MGWYGSWCRRSWEDEEEETVELGGLVPYPDDGRDASDHLLPSALRAKGKLSEAIAETFLGLSKGLLAPVWMDRGERGRVGDGVPIPRFFLLLLLRQLLERLSIAPVMKCDLLLVVGSDMSIALV